MPDTSDTSATLVRQECDLSATRTAKVRQEWKTLILITTSILLLLLLLLLLF